MKKAFSILSILLLTFGLFMTGYAKQYPSFAYDNSGFTELRQQSDLVKAFQAYCKSRDLTIEGSGADVITTWTTSQFNGICNKVGINISELQAEIKAEYDQQGAPIKFFFNSVGVGVFNRIFAQFLQDNDLYVGQEVNNKTVFNGHYYTYKTHTALCFEGSISDRWYSTENITSFGTPYTYDTYVLKDMVISGATSVTLEYDQDHVYNWLLGMTESNSYLNYNYESNTANGNYNFYADSKSGNSSNPTLTPYWRGYPVIIYNNGKYYANRLLFNVTNNTFRRQLVMSSVTQLNPSSDKSGNVFIFSPTINNNNYEGDTYINYEGDIIYNPDDPDDPDEPIYPDPEYPDPPPYDPDYPNDPVTPQTPPDWDIDLPDFTDFDWIMSGLEKKFPWDIPFNIMFMLSLFVAEPTPPHFVGDIDLKVTNWHYDLDLAPFEPLADIFRKFFFISFLLGLMLLTKQLIWG